jgi:L-threonylcarbamoyladenylate synthase
MQTKIISTQDPDAIPIAIKTLNQGGLIAFPTDTVYGLACPVNSETGIEQLFVAKDRPANKAIAVLVGSYEQIATITPEPGPNARKLAERYWPGALTLVVEKHSQLPENISPFPTVGVRMPNHPFAIQLLLAYGPLATTSANLSGGKNPSKAEDVLDQLDGRIDLVIDGGATPGGIPSTVVDCTTSQVKILRLGAISEKDIFKVIQK